MYLYDILTLWYKQKFNFLFSLTLFNVYLKTLEKHGVLWYTLFPCHPFFALLFCQHCALCHQIYCISVRALHHVPTLFIIHPCFRFHGCRLYVATFLFGGFVYFREREMSSVLFLWQTFITHCSLYQHFASFICLVSVCVLIILSILSQYSTKCLCILMWSPLYMVYHTVQAHHCHP